MFIDSTMFTDSSPSDSDVTSRLTTSALGHPGLRKGKKREAKRKKIYKVTRLELLLIFTHPQLYFMYLSLIRYKVSSYLALQPFILYKTLRISFEDTNQSLVIALLKPTIGSFSYFQYQLKCHLLR